MDTIDRDGGSPVSGNLDTVVKDTAGMTALSRAAKYGDLKLVEHLVQRDSDINALDKEEMTPMQHAVEAAKWNVVKYLVVHGAKMNVADGYGTTVLQRAMAAGEWEVVRFMINMGADVNVLDGNNVSPVGHAVTRGEWDVAKYMIERGGSIGNLSREQKDELLEKVIGQTVSEGNVHSAFYNVVRLGNVELFEILIEKTGLNDNDSTKTTLKLDDILAKTYEKLQTRNVPLSPEIKFEIENKLIGLRFFIDKTKINQATVESSLGVVKKRIETVCEQIQTLSREYSGDDGKDVDGKFTLVGRFLAQNIRVLKRQLRSTYHKLPWEEIEFCLSIFISPRTHRTIDTHYDLVLDKDRLLTYLCDFGDKLNEEKSRLGQDVNSKFPQKIDEKLSSRDDAVNSVLAASPSFQQLYNDYELIRSVYSLNRIESYIKLALSINLDEGDKDSGRLVIERTLQVIGESLKNALESPNVSDDVHQMLLYSAPSNAREIITLLRDSLSHAHTLKKRLALEDDDDSTFFRVIQNDLRKINVEIADILYKKDVEAVVTFLNKLTTCESLLEVRKLSNSLFDTDFKNVKLEDAHTSELMRMKELIEELDIELKDEKGLEFDRELVTIMRDTVYSQEKRLRNVELSFSMGLDAIRATIGQVIHNMSYDLDLIKNMSLTFLKELKPRMPVKPSKTMMVCVENIHMNVEQKMQPGSKLNRIKKVLYSLKCTIDFDASRVKGLRTFKIRLENKERVSHRAALEKMKGILKEIKENIINEQDRKVLKDILKDKKSKYKAKQYLNSIFDDLSAGLVTKDETHVKKKYRDLVAELEMKPNKSNELNEKFEKGNWIECKKIMDGLGDKYQLLLNSVKNSINSEKTPDLSSSFKRFFSSKKLNPIIEKVLKTDADQFQSYYEKRLSKLDKLLATKSTFELVTKHENDKEFQSAVDVLVLDLTDILDNTSQLGDNRLYLDGYSPVLVGKSLRNYLAHGDAFVDSLPCSTSVATISTAHLLIKATKDMFVKKNQLVGQRVEEKLDNLNERYNQSLDLINNQMEMFVASKEGNLEKVQYYVEKGVDIHSRDTKGWTGLHYAAQGDSVNVVRYFVARHLRVDVADVNGENVLYVAAKFKSNSVVKYLLDDNRVDVNSVGKTRKTLLHYIAEVGASREVVAALMEKGAPVDVKDDEGSTPLHFSALGGQMEMALALIEHGAAVDARDRIDATPLYMAALCGHPNVVAVLLDAGAAADARDKDDWTPLHNAALNGRRDVAATLLEHGAPVDVRDLVDRTPLHVAAFGGKIDVVDELIERGANVDAVNLYGMTPIHVAVQLGQKDVTLLLLNNGANVNVLNNNKQSPLHLAVSGGHVDVVQTLLAKRFSVDGNTRPENRAKKVTDVDVSDVNERTPLFIAAKFGHCDIVETLLKNGANKEANNNEGMTPLMMAALEAHANVVEILLEAGASVHARNIDGSTPLHSAVYSGSRDIVLALLNNGSKVDERDVESFTSLHLATQKGHREVVAALLDSGADVNAEGDNLVMPLHTAAKYGCKEIAEELLSRRADVGALLTDGSSPLHVASYFGQHHVARVLLKLGAGVDAVNDDSMRPLHLAAQNGYPEVVAVLLDKEADVDAVGVDSRTPLHLAAQNGHQEVATLLIDNGAQVNALDKIGSTPLHLAVEKGHGELVDVLLVNKADVNAQNVNKITPLHVAVFNGNEDLTTMLLQNGAVVDVLDKDDRTPLHFAAFAGHVGAASVLLDHKCNVDARDVNNATPLHMATETGNNGVAMALMDRGADVNATDDEEGTGPLLLAARAGETEVVSALLDRGAKVDALDDKEMTTPLHEAARKGHTTVVHVLLAAGAPVDARTVNSVTSLHFAVEGAYKDVAMVLLENGADFLARNNEDTVLHRAVDGDDEGILTYILEQILATSKDGESMYNSINPRDVVNNTPLMWAADKGRAKAAELLLGYGADIDARNDAGMTALHYATENAHLDVLRILIANKANADIRDGDGKTPYDLAWTRSSQESSNQETLDVITALLQSVMLEHVLPPPNTAERQHNKVRDDRKQYKMALIHVAALNGKLDAVLGFLDEGIDVDTRDEKNMTPLHFAAKNGHRNVVDALIEMNADVEARNVDEWTPLMFATSGSHKEVIDVLLQRKADANAQAHRLELTSLHMATLAGRADIVESLIKHGAKVDAITNDKLTVLHMASELGHSDIVDILLNNGADMEQQGKDYMRPLHFSAENEHGHLVESFLEQGANIEARAKDNWTPLHYAAVYGRENIVRVLLKRNANVHSRAKDDMRALHYAAVEGHSKVVEVLLDNGADIEGISTGGRTALHYAASNGRKVVVDLLIDKGANVNARTKTGMTPLHYSALYGHSDVVAALLERGADTEMRESQLETAEDLAAKEGHTEVISLLRIFKMGQESKNDF